LVDRGIPRAHYELFNAAEQKIGEVTSGSQSPTLGKGIGMGYVAKEYSQPDTEIFVEVRGKFLKARVVKMPFLNK
jgi:aminomethyltransferase